MVEAGNKIEYLPGLIEKTRKSRIEAERRLLKLDELSRHATIYYACITTLLTLSTLFFDYRGLILLSTASAIIATLCTVYTSSQAYGVRAEKMRECYLNLQQLHLSLDDKRYLNEEEAQQLANCAGERYVEILKCTENHLPRDFRLSKGEIDQTRESMRWVFAKLCIYIVPVIAGIVFMLVVESTR